MKPHVVMGHAVVAKGLMDATRKRAEKLQAKGKNGRFQGTAPDGA
jgi:hypothetical protein